MLPSANKLLPAPPAMMHILLFIIPILLFPSELAFLTLHWHFPIYIVIEPLILRGSDTKVSLINGGNIHRFKTISVFG